MPETVDSSASYTAAGVNTHQGDLAVSLMREAVSRTHNVGVVGGFGGFAGMVDVSFLKEFHRPVLATSTDGVGTKIAIAQALDKHDTIGQDLVGMVVDDIVVVGARPLFMTDYIACGKVNPQRIAAIVSGIAEACSETGTALVGGETAEHPGLMKADDYDLAGAATGVVDFDKILGPDRVCDGDVVLAIASSGLHSNGYSLVRHIIADHDIAYSEYSDDFGRSWGEELLEPTRLYTSPILALLADVTFSKGVHSLSHVTGGGIAANLARVLPQGAWVDVDRATWSPQPVFRVLCDLSGSNLSSTEGTWNLGIGFFVIVDPAQAGAITAHLTDSGLPTWQVGNVSMSVHDVSSYEQGAKGVSGGAVRMVGNYRD